MRFKQQKIYFLLFIILFTSCTSTKIVSVIEKDRKVPRVDREFRATWIASVANINWPSEPGLSTADQQREALFLFDLLNNHNFNAVILQVRLQCDALYHSELEPWSYFLSGAQGLPPDPFYDSLEFWIPETQKRGLELHTWLNPYRAHHKSGGEIPDVSLVKKQPDLALSLKSGYWWLDPSKTGTQANQTRLSEIIITTLNRFGVESNPGSGLQADHVNQDR
jgi:uncharacterized lipoprotein YddW (UPF0748 family)